MDVSPKQLVSVAAGLIPFLEHDDANRALMGSNMQRQGVPLLVSDSPLVGTGLEGACRTGLAGRRARRGNRRRGFGHGQPDRHHAGRRNARRQKENQHRSVNGVWVYELRKFMRSNATTCINQKPIVAKGQQVKKATSSLTGRIRRRASLPLGATSSSPSCLGTDTTSRTRFSFRERVVKDDVYTSIHIDEFEIGARDTKLGPEEITRDIPNLGEEALQNLGRTASFASEPK